jgi:hypothetical protein
MLAWLDKEGVPETALSGWAGLGPDNCGACPSPLLASRVVWQGKRFDFGPHGAVACLIIECRAEEPYDLVLSLQPIDDGLKVKNPTYDYGGRLEWNARPKKLPFHSKSRSDQRLLASAQTAARWPACADFQMVAGV